MKIKKTLSLIVMMRKMNLMSEDLYIDRIIEILIEEINEDMWHMVAIHLRVDNEN